MSGGHIDLGCMPFLGFPLEEEAQQWNQEVLEPSSQSQAPEMAAPAPQRAGSRGEASPAAERAAEAAATLVK